MAFLMSNSDFERQSRKKGWIWQHMTAKESAGKHWYTHTKAGMVRNKPLPPAWRNLRGSESKSAIQSDHSYNRMDGLSQTAAKSPSFEHQANWCKLRA